MIVPNYIPDPLEVPGNVTEQPYMVRLRFVRRVVLLYLASVAVVAGALKLTAALPGIGLLPAGLALAAMLVLLELWRIWKRGQRIESRVSALALPFLLSAVVLALREVHMAGWPIWQTVPPVVCVGLYTLLCGRDFSFVGGYLLSLIASSVSIATLAMSLRLTHEDTLFALGTSIALLTYLMYDLASLLSRRRVDEELAAVTDLYRDVLNVFGYVVRVIRHWRKHRIWNVPSPIELRWKGKG